MNGGDLQVPDLNLSVTDEPNDAILQKISDNVQEEAKVSPVTQIIEEG